MEHQNAFRETSRVDAIREKINASRVLSRHGTRIKIHIATIHARIARYIVRL